MNLEKMTLVFRQLAIEAGEKILKIYNEDDFLISIKEDKSPLTLADKMADAHISKGLALAYPEVQLISEEQESSHQSYQNEFFIVDPLDGTKEFINRNGDFTVNIAYVKNGKPVVGVVYAPDKERLFYSNGLGASFEEKGPFLHDDLGNKKQIFTRAEVRTELSIVASKSHRNKETENYIKNYCVRDIKSAGSSLKFCLIATGEADLYPRLGRTMEWDTAAGHAVLLGAGGMVVRLEDHKELTYGKSLYENPFFIAHAPNVDLWRD